MFCVCTVLVMTTHLGDATEVSIQTGKGFGSWHSRLMPSEQKVVMEWKIPRLGPVAFSLPGHLQNVAPFVPK